METKPCILCGDELECAVKDWSTLQPHKGGQVTFNFSYGSCKFDLCPSSTTFKGVICDECAKKCMSRMKLSNYDGAPYFIQNPETGEALLIESREAYDRKDHT